MEVQIDTKLDAGLYLWTWGNGYRSSFFSDRELQTDMTNIEILEDYCTPGLGRLTL